MGDASVIGLGRVTLSLADPQWPVPVRPLRASLAFGRCAEFQPAQSLGHSIVVAAALPDSAAPTELQMPPDLR